MSILAINTGIFMISGQTLPKHESTCEIPLAVSFWMIFDFPVFQILLGNSLFSVLATPSLNTVELNEFSSTEALLDHVLYNNVLHRPTKVT